MIGHNLIDLIPLGVILIAIGKILQVQLQHTSDISEAFTRIRTLEKLEREHHDRLITLIANYRGVRSEDITDF